MNIKELAIRWHETKRALMLVWKSSPRWSVYNGILLTVKGLMPLLFIYLIKVLIDSSTLVFADGQRASDYTELFLIIAATGIVFLINSLTGSFGTYIQERHSFFVNDYIKNKIHERTSKMSFSYFENYHFQDILHRAVNESSFRPSRIFYGLISLCQNLFTLIIVSAILATLHYLVTITVIIISIPIIYIRLRNSRELYNLKRKQTTDERKVGYYDTLLTDRTFAKEVRLFNLDSIFRDRYRSTNEKLRENQLKTVWTAAKNETYVQVLTALLLFGVYAFIALYTYKGIITSGSMVMYFLVLQRGYSVLQDFLSRIANLYDDSLYLKDLFEFFDFEIEKESAERTKSFPSPITKGITFESVGFKYAHSSRKVFRDFNFHINTGETLAVVGANGCGKTTLVKLLCNLYEPTKGKILIDGINLHEIKKESISKNVSAIFQDFTLYNVSAKENIWFGDMTKNGDLEEIRDAAEIAGVDKLLQSLPQKYENTLGNLFEGSEMLSQGEWQRIALARSIYHNSELIILDEPTSSLDSFTEAKLITHFKEITKNRTAVIISHRLNTIRIADRILMLEEDGNHELGTHDELIAKKGAYFEMISALENA